MRPRLYVNFRVCRSLQNLQLKTYKCWSKCSSQSIFNNTISRFEQDERNVMRVSRTAIQVPPNTSARSFHPTFIDNLLLQIKWCLEQERQLLLMLMQELSSMRARNASSLSRLFGPEFYLTGRKSELWVSDHQDVCIQHIYINIHIYVKDFKVLYMSSSRITNTSPSNQPCVVQAVTIIIGRFQIPGYPHKP